MSKRANALAVLLLLSGGFPAQAMPGDYDGDGKSDVFWRNTSIGANVIWKSGNASTRQAVRGVTNQSWKVAGVGDFDGDGRSDVFWRNASTGANVIWKSANATLPQAVVTVTNLDWQVVGVGDFDGDARSDVFWRNTGTGANVIWKAANAFMPQATAGVTNQDWMVVGIGDFDGDGKSDVFWRNTRSGANAIWKAGNISTRQMTVAVRNQDWKVAGIGDFDGDGRADAFWRNTYTGANVIWRSGNATALMATAGVSDQRWQVAGVGDFDGDGSSDVLWRNLSFGFNEIWKSGSASTLLPFAAVSDMAWSIVPYEAQTFSQLSISDVSVAEGNSGPRQMVFMIRLSQPSASPVTYNVAIDEYGDGNVENAARDDYTGTSLTGQTIPAGQISTTFAITINGDTAAEANERIPVEVNGVTGAVAVDDLAIGTILNDDANTLWIGDASIYEGDTGTQPMAFTIRLSRPSATAITYDIATADLGPGAFHATAGYDYIAGSLTGEVIPAGSISKTFTVTILNDTSPELFGESFNVNVSNVMGAIVVDGQATGHITDDESPYP
jgi:hypothetical protein